MIVKLINWLLRILPLTKNYRLARDANKSVVYGALVELTKNTQLWKHSSVGREYSEFTPEGREVIVGLMQDILRTVDVLDRKSLDQRAKEMVFETLKGKHEG
jgi:hypothetical protein